VLIVLTDPRVLGVTGVLGDTDCEELAGGLVHQPVNAATSLAYLLAGVLVAVWGVRNQRVRSSEALVYGLAMVAAGIGSVDYHGPASDLARLLHDGGIAAVVLFMAVHDVALVRGASRRWFGVTYGICLAVTLALFAAWPDISLAATGLVVAVAVVGEVIIWRRRLRPLGGTTSSRRVTYLVALAALTTGVVVNVLTRTGAPLCDPHGLWQGHGLWHVLTAVALGLWAVVALDPAGRTSRTDRPQVGTDAGG